MSLEWHQRVYPHGDDKSVIEFKREESEDMVIILDCSTSRIVHIQRLWCARWYTEDVKLDMCTRYYGADWKWEAEKNDERKREEYGEKEYSLKLKGSSMGYMDIKNVDFRYDPEKDQAKNYG